MPEAPHVRMSAVPRFGSVGWVLTQWLTVVAYLALAGGCGYVLITGVGAVEAEWFFLLLAFFIGQFVIGHSMMMLGPSLGKSLGLSKKMEIGLLPLLYMPFIVLVAWLAGSLVLGVIHFLQMVNGLRLLAETENREGSQRRFFLGLAQLILAFWTTLAVMGIAGIEVGDPLINTANSLDRAEWSIEHGSRLATIWMGLAYCLFGAGFALPRFQRWVIGSTGESAASADEPSNVTAAATTKQPEHPFMDVSDRW